jgi:2-polyprenyl-6-methoxyphenol hydroxylase-like FAD-dependent oxidoreductase
MALARQGDEVTVVDRDPGPAAGESWRRRGVMQFPHPHYFRHLVRLALQDRLPDVWEQLLAAGGVPANFDGAPEFLTGLQCRRSTFERVLWEVAAREPRLTMRTGLVSGLVSAGGRAAGVVVDGSTLPADRVICSTGRGSSLGDDLRAPGSESPCGFSYVARMYQARPGAPWPTWALSGRVYDGYQAILFPQDNNTLSALVVLPSHDSQLAELRQTEAFDVAASLIPQLAPWTDSELYEPITAPMTGGRLTNGYRGQLDETGQVRLAGVYFVGDAVCTTNPAAGRGVSLGLQQAQALLTMLAETDARDTSVQFDAWCDEHIRPWYDDHMLWDAELLRRFAGEDLDVEGPLSSDIYCTAAESDPSLLPTVGPVLGMLTTPDSLGTIDEHVRDMLQKGWRPGYATGPTRDELVERMAPRATRPTAPV